MTVSTCWACGGRWTGQWFYEGSEAPCEPCVTLKEREFPYTWVGRALVKISRPIL